MNDTILREWKTSDSGNSVGNYTEQLIECDCENCFGKGILSYDEEFDITIDCPKCNGSGRVEKTIYK
jgi:DnaJ-class molecular chaperone